ncbi:hypothetical protein K227x_62020 [Rubripirellula lacrimiformis]|uniref:Uncharacterized protein n=1 Tax=Rubripirellula lacrimiformis TaxID=1930273 RepID=A0A517NKV9_9BACT|nr:hypothetical protein [Rubripirellula lacrimiformis]QDT07774.1 hypothetical protein K227x_62020 [Rubripirellula lacrimiformis]
MAPFAAIDELNHEDSLNGSAVVTDDVEIAVRQYMRKKPDEFYNNLTPQESKKHDSCSPLGRATAMRIVHVGFDVGSESLHGAMELPTGEPQCELPQCRIRFGERLGRMNQRSENEEKKIN